MKVLFAIKSLNVPGGGAERVLVDIANGLHQRGHTVSVLTFDKPGRSFYPLNPEICRIDIGLGHPGMPTPRIAFIRAMSRIRSSVRREHPDLVIAFMHSTYVPLTFALLGLRVPMVVSDHVSAVHYCSRVLQRILTWCADRLASAKVVPSLGLWNEHSQAFRKKLRIIPNPIQVKNYVNTPAIKEIDRTNVLSIGRLTEEKGHLTLVRAFGLVATEFPEWELRIIGDGELRPHLEREITALGLADRVSLPGFKQDVANEYLKSSFVALPSKHEAFGMVAAEALASARPVVAFDHCNGITELVQDGINGLLVNAGVEPVTAMASGLKRMMADEQLRLKLGEVGPLSLAKYEPEIILDHWEKLIKQFNSRSLSE